MSTLLTTSGLVLAYLASRPESTLDEIGLAVGVTSKTALSCCRTLRKASLITEKPAWDARTRVRTVSEPLGSYAAALWQAEALCEANGHTRTPTEA